MREKIKQDKLKPFKREANVFLTVKNYNIKWFLYKLTFLLSIT